MKLLSFLIFISLSPYLLAADTVRITDPTNLVVTGFTNTTFTLNTDPSSGDSTTEAAPATVYVPMHNAIANHDLYFSQYSASGLNVLFNSTDATDVVNFPLTTNVTGTVYLYAAAKLSTGKGYKLVKQYSTSAATSANIEFPISPEEICAQYTTDCASLVPTGTSSTAKVSFTLYFFLSTSPSIALGDTVTPSGTDGIYFDFVMSNKIYLPTELLVSINNSRKGDSRVMLDYSSTASMLDFDKVIIFEHDTATPGTTNGPIGLYTGALINRDFSSTQSGSLTVNQLQNGIDVTLSVAFEDKFGFATTLSKVVTVRPTEIQELLKKQACYLLTAGFGEEHYIINFFRSYRDHILAHSWLGQKFIKFYYRTAPQYAMFIYKSEVLRFSIRSVAYTLYFFFNYYLFIFFLFIFSIAIFKYKNKLKFSRNRI